MQFGSADAPVETHSLLSALGVDNKFEQSDAQEIHRRLLDALQEAFERRPSVRCDGANPVAQIFEGKIVTSIRCTDVDFTSEKVDTFQDVRLVKNWYSIDRFFNLMQYRDMTSYQGLT